MTNDLPTISTSATILVVDDTPANLQLLVGMLKERGYKTRIAPNGKLALHAAQANSPDLILLDINMPDMDGYTVCRQLKADEKLKEIPVIFLSALNETTDKIKAFSVGAVDYISKPFQFEEVDARVKTHLTLMHQKKEIERNFQQLKELENLRDNLVHMIVHDMRSPLGMIQGAFDLLLMEVSSQIDPELMEIATTARNETVNLTEMVTQLLDISRMESGQMPIQKTRQDLAETLEEALKALSSLMGKRKNFIVNAEPFMAEFDKNLVRRVVINLLANAIKFTPDDGEIKLSILTEDNKVRVNVSDNGVGIPLSAQKKIFEKFGQVEGEKRKNGTGLGLTFCKLAVESLGGTIGVDSADNNGSTFWFTLPVLDSLR